MTFYLPLNHKPYNLIPAHGYLPMCSFDESYNGFWLLCEVSLNQGQLVRFWKVFENIFVPNPFFDTRHHHQRLLVLSPTLVEDDLSGDLLNTNLCNGSDVRELVDLQPKKNVW